MSADLTRAYLAVERILYNDNRTQLTKHNSTTFIWQFLDYPEWQFIENILLRVQNYSTIELVTGIHCHCGKMATYGAASDYIVFTAANTDCSICRGCYAKYRDKAPIEHAVLSDNAIAWRVSSVAWLILIYYSDAYYLWSATSIDGDICVPHAGKVLTLDHMALKRRYLTCVMICRDAGLPRDIINYIMNYCK